MAGTGGLRAGRRSARWAGPLEPTSRGPVRGLELPAVPVVQGAPRLPAAPWASPRGRACELPGPTPALLARLLDQDELDPAVFPPLVPVLPGDDRLRAALSDGLHPRCFDPPFNQGLFHALRPVL